MKKITTKKVIGIEDLVRIYCDQETSDSYETHLEDPETLETVQHQYIVGTKDLHDIFEGIIDEKVESGELSAMTDPRGLVTVYAHIEDANLRFMQLIFRNASYDCTPSIILGRAFDANFRATYHDLYIIKENILAQGERNHWLSDNMRMVLDWISSLPYQELLMLTYTTEVE